MMLRKYIVEWRGFANRWNFYDRYFTLYGAMKAAAKASCDKNAVHNWKVSKMNGETKETKMLIHRRAAS